MNRLWKTGVAVALFGLLWILIFQKDETPPENPEVSAAQANPPPVVDSIISNASPEKDVEFKADSVALDSTGTTLTASLIEKPEWPDAGPGEVISDFSAIVQDGESYLTSGHEIEEGVFAFTRIAPVVENLEDGSNAIRLEANRFSVDVSGNLETLSTPALVILPGAYGIISLSEEDRTFSLTVQAERLPDGTGFILHGIETDSKKGEENPL